MDIHKPKPWHGAREFLKEYVIIVVGVLTALAGEQAVEWVHRQHEVTEARESLHEEVARNGMLMQFSLEASPCFQRWLDTVTAWVNGAPRPALESGALDTLGASAWDEAKVSAVALMPLKERLAFDRYYATVADRGDVIRAERASMVALAGFAGEAQVPPEERFHARQEVSRIKAQQMILAGYDRAMLEQTGAMGVTPSPRPAKSAASLARMCNRTPPVAAK